MEQTNTPNDLDFSLQIQRTYECNKRKVYLNIIREDGTVVSVAITEKKAQEILTLVNISEGS